MSFDITPQTDSDSEVTQGDKLRIRWLLNAQVDPDRLTFTVQQGSSQRVFTGADLTEVLREIDGERQWEYFVDFEIQSTFEQVDFRLSDPVNAARDTAHYSANPKVI
jgi:hypothetical protein